MNAAAMVAAEAASTDERLAQATVSPEAEDGATRTVAPHVNRQGKPSFTPAVPMPVTPRPRARMSSGPVGKLIGQ